MMKKKVDQVPVTKKGALYGIVTADEIVFNLMPKPDKNVKGDTWTGRYGEALGIFAKRDVLTNEITDSLRDVYQNMSKSGSNYSVIVGTDEIQGIVTYRDYPDRAVEEGHRQLDTDVHRRAPGRPLRGGDREDEVPRAPLSCFAGASPTSRRRGR